MHTITLGLGRLLIAGLATLALGPARSQTVEEACRARDARLADAHVRIAWTTVDTGNDDVDVAYCVLHGDANARLSFERDAEIVYFALSSEQPHSDARAYTFTIKTSQGRSIRQGPALIQPLARQPQSCRVDVCQFFTEPGERVVSVAVETGRK